MKRLTPITITFKLLSLLLLTLTLYHNASLVWGQDGYKKGIYELNRTLTDGSLVTRINGNQILQEHLSGFQSLSERIIWKWGRRYRFIRDEDEAQIWSTIAVYPTIRDAEENVLDLLNDMSAVFGKGTMSGALIGDNSWWYKGGSGAGSVIFVRKNVLMNIFSSDYALAEIIAKAIDNDIVNNAAGIKVGGSVFPPVIEGMDISSNYMRVGDTATVAIDGMDPKGEELSYSFIGGVILTNKDGTFTYLAQQVGRQKIGVITINESNVVSTPLETEIVVEAAR